MRRSDSRIAAPAAACNARRRRPAAGWVLPLMAMCLISGTARAQRYVPGENKLYQKIKYGDSLVSPNDRCAVRKNPLNTHIRPVYVNRTPVGFCCSGCPPVFIQDPGRYLKELKIQLPDPVDAARPATLDTTLRAYVNQDVFLFASASTMKKFQKNPIKYCGMVGDVVNGNRFQPTRNSPTMEYNGRSFYFQSDSTRVTFAVSPELYWTRR